MKKVILALSLAFSMCAFSQSDSTKKSLDCYVGTSISTSVNDNFNQGTYTGVEVGVCAKNMVFGFATGRGNIDFSSRDVKQNYWYEVKAYEPCPLEA